LKTLLLRDGDLVPSHRDFLMVRGAGKVAQDLRCALLEPLGNDRFHTGWGSSLQNFIASIADEGTRMEIEAEVNRVISNYAAIQRDKVEADISGDEDSRFTTSEILSRVQNVTVSVASETVNINISLRTVAGEVIVLAEAVS
jgi:phage baseplate assembly protein W